MKPSRTSSRTAPGSRSAGSPYPPAAGPTVRTVSPAAALRSGIFDGNASSSGRSRVRTVGPAEDAARRPLVAVGLDREPAGLGELRVAHGPEASAPPARSGAILHELVASDPKRQVRLDVLDRVVARVAVERVHGVEPVL